VLQGLARVTLHTKVTCVHSHKKAGKEFFIKKSVFGKLLFHLVMPSISFDIQQAGNLRSMVFGGEGIFLATLRGTGRVWLQSMPIRKLIAQLSSFGPNSRKEGSGGLLNTLFERS